MADLARVIVWSVSSGKEMKKRGRGYSGARAKGCTAQPHTPQCSWRKGRECSACFYRKGHAEDVRRKANRDYRRGGRMGF